MKKLIIGLYIIVFCLVAYTFFVRFSNKNIRVDMPLIIKKTSEDSLKVDKKKVTLSFVGDCTIGWDPRYWYGSRFDKYFDDNNGDYAYYFAKVKEYLDQDDITVANLEGQFTSSNDIVEKAFNFKAPTSYVDVLKKGSIEMVSFANNHAYDFGKSGYDETIKTLNDNNVLHYGYSDYLIKEVNGIKIGFMAFNDIDCVKYGEAKKGLDYLKENGAELIIVSVHWGIEKDLVQNNAQQKMGRYLIDNGADLVVGTHPHVIQGIEKYNDKYIIYSLANFVFGGNQNPPDKDTFMFRQTFNFSNGELQLDDNIEIVPASVSGFKNKNNYQPVILDGEEKVRVFNKIMKYSSGFNYGI